RLWQPHEKRKSALVFIGRNLDAEKLKADFLDWLAYLT
ncbi:MAG: GTP-binding protein, partial [Pseudanabaena sp.]